MKLDLLTDATVIEDAIRFLEGKSHLSANNSSKPITNNKQQQEEHELTNNVF
jgi:hypothetical protein